jgi:hypothetical protein
MWQVWHMTQVWNPRNVSHSDTMWHYDTKMPNKIENMPIGKWNRCDSLWLYAALWHLWSFVTPEVFKFIGPSCDSRRHDRDTYLFCHKVQTPNYEICERVFFLSSDCRARRVYEAVEDEWNDAIYVDLGAAGNGALAKRKTWTQILILGTVTRALWSLFKFTSIDFRSCTKQPPTILAPSWTMHPIQFWINCVS